MKYIIITIFCVVLQSCATSDRVVPAANNLNIENAIPIIVVQPNYPHHAVINGIEGYVKFVFDISVEGKVKNAKIVESVPEGVFDSAAMKVLPKWIFRAASENGTALEQSGFTYTMQFKFAP